MDSLDKAMLVFLGVMLVFMLIVIGVNINEVAEIRVREDVCHQMGGALLEDRYCMVLPANNLVDLGR
jgi:hypothetical protein